ncbi:MAG: ABC transporter substrate-binding protein [Bacteroidales bacterium]|nr:ABC transporter substrate-binding protein [Bacteroidales bacterium]
MRIFTPLILLSGLLLINCSNNNRKISEPEETKATLSGIEYATGFDIQYTEGYTRLSVKSPWQKAGNVEYEYLLYTREDSLPDRPNIFRVPVQNVICLSTTHLAMINFIGKAGTISGISGSRYISNPEVSERIKTGEVADVGYGENLSFETIINIHPDVVFVYGVSGTVLKSVTKLEELGIQVVFVADYLEDTPLGKMEWIKFIAAFYNKEKEAAIKFDSIADNYLRLTNLAKTSTYKPKIMLGMPWQGTWYVSGGKSYIARLIQDAGGDYVWHNLDSKESEPVNLESVFSKTLDADIWLNVSSANSLKDITDVDERFDKIKAFKTKRVFNNNLRVNVSGGNDYWESGIVHPDKILADMIFIFHPELISDHTLYYYQQME